MLRACRAACCPKQGVRQLLTVCIDKRLVSGNKIRGTGLLGLHHLRRVKEKAITLEKAKPAGRIQKL